MIIEEVLGWVGAELCQDQLDTLVRAFGETPETAKGEVLTVSGLKDPEDEFKSIVEHNGLEGILFEELWSDSR